MAYTAPPTFTSGSVLSAAQMNILSDDIEYLYGKVGGPIPATNAHFTASDADYYYAFRYKWRYLHLGFDVVGNAGNQLKIYITDDDGAEELIYNDDPGPSAGVYREYIDLEAGTVHGQNGGASWSLNLTVGNIYQIHVDWDDGSNNNFSFYYFINSDSTTL